MTSYRLLELGYWRMVATFIDVALLVAAVSLLVGAVTSPVPPTSRVRPHRGPRRQRHPRPVGADVISSTAPSSTSTAARRGGAPLVQSSTGGIPTRDRLLRP